MVRSASPSNPESIDATTAADERRLRKKIQNRLNQRSFRQYLTLLFLIGAIAWLTSLIGLRNQDGKSSKASKVTAKQRQYHVNRWRLDEEEYEAPVLPSHSSISGTRGHVVHKSLGSSESSQVTTWFPLPADHLIHLIKHNVFRALARNKAMLQHLAVQYRNTDLQIEADFTMFPGYSVILPVAPHLSGCLTPTISQMSIVHSTWINILPFPGMRDKLIQREFEFDHSDFVNDLVGEEIDSQIFLSPPTSSRPTGTVTGTAARRVDLETFNTATGLIVWGEPYIIDSWEATPNFLQKWGWAVAGCQELINSTNWWRETRGEMPLRIEPSTTTTDHFNAD